jgi:hypothetical protein
MYLLSVVKCYLIPGGKRYLTGGAIGEFLPGGPVTEAKEIKPLKEKPSMKTSLRAASVKLISFSPLPIKL